MRTSTRDRNDLITEVLFILGVAQAGQPIPAEVANRVDEKLNGILEELNGRDVVSVPDTAYIPIAIFNPLATIVAGRVGPDFGIVGAEVAQMRGEAREAEREIRQIVATKRSWQPLTPDYF